MAIPTKRRKVNRRSPHIKRGGKLTEPSWEGWEEWEIGRAHV